ncbi:MAG: phosphatase PAP2 family protein [Pseudarcicella sp.]|nr:phosphatase PAP2 family protein [Pseudarcicella sp.]
MIRKILQTNITYWSAYLILFSFVLIWTITHTKFEQMACVNHAVCHLGNAFFQMSSSLGEPLFFLSIIIAYLFIDYSKSLTLLLSLITSALVVRILKLAFDTSRPKLYFKDVEYLWRFVPNENVNIYNSFPSGHTTTSFLLFTSLALFNNNKKYSLVYLFFAIMTGFSRVYLFQHFPEDILAGSVLGIFFAILFYCFRQKTLIQNPVTPLKSYLFKKA